MTVFKVTPTKEIKIYREKSDGSNFYAHTLYTHDEFVVIATNLKEAKQKFKEEHHLKSYRNLKFEEVELAKGFQTLRDDRKIMVFFNNKHVYTWNDDAQHHCPEDLIWSRVIGDIFYDAVKIGREIERNDY